jgi:predicted hydrocarbon binding protein
MERESRYAFSWDLLGDVSKGRPNLGPSTSVHMYRLMQYTLRDAIDRRLGADLADELFFAAGHTAGVAVYDHLVGGAESVEELFASLQKTLRELQVGVLRVEESDPNGDRFVVTVSEDLDCSGLPVLDTEVCTFDEGLIAGILERHTGQRYKVEEIDCWCTGDRTCRFLAERQAVVAEPDPR